MSTTTIEQSERLATTDTPFRAITLEASSLQALGDQAAAYLGANPGLEVVNFSHQRDTRWVARHGLAGPCNVAVTRGLLVVRPAA